MQFLDLHIYRVLKEYKGRAKSQDDIIFGIPTAEAHRWAERINHFFEGSGIELSFSY